MSVAYDPCPRCNGIYHGQTPCGPSPSLLLVDFREDDCHVEAVVMVEADDDEVDW